MSKPEDEAAWRPLTKEDLFEMAKGMERRSYTRIVEDKPRKRERPIVWPSGSKLPIEVDSGRKK